MHRNIEIKARYPEIQKIRKILESYGADYIGLDHQIDTYFKVPNGRLKLREGNLEKSLIYYERNNQEGPKDSNVILCTTSSIDSSLKDLLTRSLGVLIHVEKLRHIYFINNIKFHIDIVNSLGSFCEIEAIDKDGKIGSERLLQQCQYYMKILDIKKEDLISCSYSDLLLENNLSKQF